MSRPRVESLIYEFVTVSEGRDFSNAPPFERDLGPFRCRLETEKLTAWPKDHYPTVDEAEEALDPYLRAWEAWAELQVGAPVRFLLEGGNLVDSDTGVGLGGTVGANMRISRATIRRTSYPSPPSSHFNATDLVVALTERVGRSRGGREPRLGAANWVLTKLEGEFGSRQQVGERLNVSWTVLKRLGELAARNDPVHGRKGKGPISRLSDSELNWVDEALDRLIERVAELAGGASNLAQVNLDDLPPLGARERTD